MENEVILHPRNPDAATFGRRMKSGEVIQSGDVYDSTSGQWENAPCPGLVIREGCPTVWVTKRREARYE